MAHPWQRIQRLSLQQFADLAMQHNSILPRSLIVRVFRQLSPILEKESIEESEFVSLVSPLFHWDFPFLPSSAAHAVIEKLDSLTVSFRR